MAQSGGGDVARKGGPGIARADLLVINKTDLGPHVDVDVDQMVADATAARQGGPVLALSRKDQASVERLCAWVRWMHQQHVEGAHTPTDPGPMAPHFHALGEADDLFHAHGAADIEDDGSVPAKQIWRWKDDGGAIGGPVPPRD